MSHVGPAFWSDVLDPRFWGRTRAYTLVDALLGARLAAGHVSLLLRGTDLADRRVQQPAYGDVIRRRVVVETRLRFGSGT